MDNVVDFKPKPAKKMWSLNGKFYEPPKNGAEYLYICKQTFTEAEYRDILCGILDSGIYRSLEPRLIKVVDSYYTFKS
jgi:hypothetical protein